MKKHVLEIVRDNAVSTLENKNKKFKFTILKESEILYECKLKILGKARDFFLDETIEELADLYAILEKTSEIFGGIENVKQVAKEIAKEKGGFTKNILLDWVEDAN